MDHEGKYDRLVRVRALMYEIIRFFPPVPMLPRSNGNQLRALTIRGQQYVIPAKTFVSVNMNATHRNPAIWGADVKEFKSSRWVKASGVAGSKQFGGPPDGAEVFQWAFGPRVCPGKKFSQVEFAAGIACLLGDRDVRPMAMPAERMAETRA